MSVLIPVFGVIVPKSYGLGHAEAWSLRVARPISYVERALGPIVAVFDRFTRWLTARIGGDQHIEKAYTDDRAKCGSRAARGVSPVIVAHVAPRRPHRFAPSSMSLMSPVVVDAVVAV